MKNVDQAEKALGCIISDTTDDLEKVVTEEDSKVRLINRIFHECLGWPYQAFSCENNHDNGFSDYILSTTDTPALVVEAKRIGKLQVDTTITEKCRALKISGSPLKPCIEGIKQAHSYASEICAPISVLTDGIIWVVFKNWVPGGYKEKEAFVFPSFKAIQESFSKFFDLLSYKSFLEKNYSVLFDEVHNSREYLTMPLSAALEQSQINILHKSPISFDLEKILNNFFSQLIGDEDNEIMRECFVESNESRIADYSLEKITTTLLNNLPLKSGEVGKQLSSLIEGNVNSEMPSDSDLSVFIVGPTGSGKTTYIDRFFSKILSDEIRSNCLLININSLDASGDESTSVSWLTETIINILERKLFDEGFPSYSELQGMYFSHYKRMATGRLKKIYENDREDFDKRFADFLEQETEGNREGYLESLLQFSINNRKKLPIIIVDNTDEFSLDFKIKIYQLCNAYRRRVNLCMLIFPVTDKSAWSFSKTDIFTIHQSRSFFLPTPSPREVFRKRIEYLNKKIILANPTDSKEYLTQKGIRIKLDDVSKFAQVLEDVFVQNSFTAKTLGEITNYNIRSIMSLSKRIITSPVMRIEDLITSFITTEPISYSKFIDALIRGNYEAFKVTTGDDFGVVSVFKVSSEKCHSPLLNLRVLALLRVAKRSGRNVEERHMTIPSITQYFETLGLDSIDIENVLKEAISLRLIETYDPSESVLNDSQRVAITYKGNAHYNLATRNSVYFYQMALTTALSDPETAAKIKEVYNSKKSFSDRTKEIRKMFSNYLINEDAKYVLLSQSHQQFECQFELLRSISSFNNDRNEDSNELNESYSEFKDKILIGEVVRYDSDKGFGFISIEDLNDDVYFKLSHLDNASVRSVYDGDFVYCTLV